MLAGWKTVVKFPDGVAKEAHPGFCSVEYAYERPRAVLAAVECLGHARGLALIPHRPANVRDIVGDGNGLYSDLGPAMIQQLPMCHHALGMLRQVDEDEYKVDFRLKPGTPPPGAVPGALRQGHSPQRRTACSPSLLRLESSWGEHQRIALNLDIPLACVLVDPATLGEILPWAHTSGAHS